MTLLLIALAWMALALPIGLLVGRGTRLADHRDEVARRSIVPDVIPDEILASVAAQHRSS